MLKARELGASWVTDIHTMQESWAHCFETSNWSTVSYASPTTQKWEKITKES